MKRFEAIFEKTKIFIFFLCELPLILRVGRKRGAANIYKGTPDIEFEQDWLVGLGAKLRDRQKIKNYLSCFKVFWGKIR